MVIISLKVSPAGSWCACRSCVTLFSNMQLGPAIALAESLRAMNIVVRDEGSG